VQFIRVRRFNYFQYVKDILLGYRIHELNLLIESLAPLAVNMRLLATWMS
jgi:hypothetical protein